MHLNGEFRLGRRELEILNVVWDLSEATVQEVCDRLARPHHSTVHTMMRTLECKGLLDHRVFGRTFVYRSLVSREHVRGSKVRELCDVLFGGSFSLIFTSMLHCSSMSRAELGELRRLLKEIEVEGDDA
jgi:BlaI family penicillinase repressor